MRSIIIDFGTRNIERARESLKEVVREAKAALKSIKDGKERAAARRAINEEARAVQENLAARERLLQRGDGTAGRLRGALFSGGTAFDPLQRVRQGLGAAASLGGNLATGNLGGTLNSLASGVGGLLPKLGPLAAIAGSVVELVRAEVERQEARRVAIVEAQVQAEVARALERADVRGRLERDPFFRRQQERRAAEAFVAAEAARAAGGFHPRGRRLIEVQ